MRISQGMRAITIFSVFLCLSHVAMAETGRHVYHAESDVVNEAKPNIKISERRRPVTDGFERAPSERQAIVDSTDTHNTHDRSDEDSIIKHVKRDDGMVFSPSDESGEDEDETFPVYVPAVDGVQNKDADENTATDQMEGQPTVQDDYEVDLGLGTGPAEDTTNVRTLMSGEDEGVDADEVQIESPPSPMEDSDIAPGESAEEILADGQDLEENSGVSSGLEGAQGEKLGLERAQTEQPGLEEAQDSSVADESLPETGEEVVQSEESVTDGDAQMQETRPDIVTVNTGTSQTEPQGDTEQAVGGEEIVLGDVESEDGDEITGDEIMGDEKLTSAETVLGDGPGRVDTGYMGMLSANGPYTQDEVAGDEELVDDEKLTGDANLMDGDIFTEDEKLMGDEEIVSDEKLIGGDILVGDDELVGGVLSLENGDSADTLAQAERMPSPVGSTPETGLKNEDKEAERDENGPETDGGAPQNQAGGPEVAGSTAALAGAAPGSGTAGVAEDKADGPVDSDADADDEDDEEKEAEEMPHGLEEGDTEETDHSRKMFFIFVVLALCVGVVHALITLDFHWLPESIAVILVGMFIGLCTSSLGDNWKKEETLAPTAFFLVLLPPIIFESGYSLHKGNFFRNIGTILTFAVAGTLLSAFLIGVSLYVLGSVGLSYSMSFIHCLVFGSLISAIDPVATLAIFKALKVDQILEALVFGESVLNDAVAIVATRTLLTIADEGEVNMGTFFRAISIFFVMGFGSAFLGIISGLISALVTKHVALHKSPSLEFSIVCVFAYLPYWLAEALDLSGIMAILFCGIVMAHYTHPNLSPITQITSQNTFRTMAFLAETAVFAYLGLAVFSFAHSFDWGLIFWSLVLCFVSRALNIFPLASLVNKHRKVKIPFKFQVIMWFSGLRGAIAFTLSLDLPEVHFAEQYRVLVTTTLVIVIFTIVVCGGCTLPLLKALGLQVDTRDIDMSKTEQMGEVVDALQMETEEAKIIQREKNDLFMQWDAKYFRPFFCRRVTKQEVEDHEREMSNMTLTMYERMKSLSMVLPHDEHDNEVACGNFIGGQTLDDMLKKDAREHQM